jgi:hypothetical protein
MKPGRDGLKSVTPRILAVALGLTILSCSLHAEETTGRLPYKAIAELFDGFAKVKAKDKLELEVRVVPAPNVSLTKSIQLQLDSKSGRTELVLLQGGALKDFPLTDALRKENPWILSNQPKGTLNLVAELRVKYPGESTALVQYYREALEQVNGAIKSQAGLLSVVAPTAKTILFSFDPTTKPVVKLRGKDGEQTFTGDEHGFVKLELGKLAKDATSVIVLPATPKKINGL